MTLKELGAALRAEREKRGLTVEDVANRLKIGARQLRALEEGDASSLPHLAYTKGFIRSYAAYVGLGAEEVHAALIALEAENEPPAPQSVYVSESVFSPRRNLKPVAALVAALLVAAALYAAWHQGAFEFLSSQTRRLAQPLASQPKEAAEPARPGAAPQSAGAGGENTAERGSPPAARSSVAANQAPGQPPVPSSGLPSGQPPVPSSGLPSGQTPGQASAQGAGQASAQAQGRAAAQQPPEPAPAQQAAPATAVVGPYKVIVTAVEECWVHSNADNTDTRQFSLHKGETFALTFNKSLELKLGNAGGVRIRYNGEDMPPAGQSGQVRTVTFPPAR